jgi:hypothetical protein
MAQSKTCLSPSVRRAGILALCLGVALVAALVSPPARASDPFDLSISSTDVTVTPGQTIHLQVTARSNSSRSFTVSLSCTSVIAHATCNFAPSSIVASPKGSSSTLTVVFSTRVTTGVHHFSVTGTSGSTKVSPSVEVVVQAAVSVSVSPASASIPTGTSQNFTATVTNDSAGKGVNWTLSGPGTLSATSSASGAPIAYTAPATVPSPSTVTLTATSVADATKSASATITVTAALPAPVDLGPLTSPLIQVDVNNNIDIVGFSGTGIVFRRSTDAGGTFSTVTVLASSTAPLVGLQMGLDNQGHITLLWEDWQNQRAFLSFSPDGVTFSAPLMLPAGVGVICGLGPCTVDTGLYPQLSVAPSGAVNIASVGSVSAPNSGITSMQTPDGGLTFTATVVSGNDATGLLSLTGPQGQDYVFWTLGGNIFFSASPDGQTFGPTVNISNNSDSDMLYAFVDSAGIINVTWRNGIEATMNETNALMFSRSADLGKTFTSPLQVLSTTEFVIPDHQHIAVETSGAIDLTVNADSEQEGGPVLFTRSVNNGANFATPQALTAGGQFPTLGLDSCGGINVAWNSSEALGSDDILLTRSTDGSTFSTPANLSNNQAMQTSFVPQIATDAVGHTFVIWKGGAGSNDVFFIVAGTCHP